MTRDTAERQRAFTGLLAHPVLDRWRYPELFALVRKEIPAGLVEWARLPGPALVLQEVRGRAAKGVRTEQGTLRVELTTEQRREVARLLGTSWEISDRAVRMGTSPWYWPNTV
jgi:hypothetical protein